MARKKSANTGSFTPITFMRCDLNAEDKKHMAKWAEKPTLTLDDMVIQVLQTGHKISYSFNDTNDSFIVSVTGKPEDCINASSCYTSHAKDPIKALWVAMYKFFVIWKAQAWETLEDAEDFG